MEQCLSESILIPFWNTLVSTDDPAVWQDGALHLTYGALINEIQAWKLKLNSSRKELVLISASADASMVAPIVACLDEKHAVILVDAKLPKSSFEAVVELYHPAFIIECSHKSATLRNTDYSSPKLNDDLCLLLSTSGSTGSPKFVRLSTNAVLSNAFSVAKALDLSKNDIAVGHLGVNYSYGWSVISSVLAVGGSVSFTSSSITERGFWDAIRKTNATHFPGVPAHYQMMCRLRLDRLNIPTVVSMTQAGGRLNVTLRREVYKWQESHGGKFFVMYGQTEAGPRMSTLQHGDFETHENSVGPAIESGIIRIKDGSGQELLVGEEGEVFYEGPNVMDGYASGWEDLALGDQLRGILRTGDIGFTNSSGFLYLTGRISRFAKVLGLRINLDEIEASISILGSYYVIQSGENLVVIRQKNDLDYSAEEKHTLLAKLEDNFSIPRVVWCFNSLDVIPVNERNKTDYLALEKGLRDVE